MAAKKYRNYVLQLSKEVKPSRYVSILIAQTSLFSPSMIDGATCE